MAISPSYPIRAYLITGAFRKTLLDLGSNTSFFCEKGSRISSGIAVVMHSVDVNL